VRSASLWSPEFSAREIARKSPGTVDANRGGMVPNQQPFRAPFQTLDYSEAGPPSIPPEPFLLVRRRTPKVDDAPSRPSTWRMDAIAAWTEWLSRRQR
jgi:hypothetical protein